MKIPLLSQEHIYFYLYQTFILFPVLMFQMSINKYADKLWCIHTIDLQSAAKKNELLKHTTRVDLK